MTEHLRRSACALVLMFGLWPLSGRAGEALPTDLALVPADALGFLHVRVGEVWRSDAFKEWRDTVMKAGAPALAAFDQRFFPTPSSVERTTLYFNPPEKDEREPQLFLPCPRLLWHIPPGLAAHRAPGPAPHAAV